MGYSLICASLVNNWWVETTWDDGGGVSLFTAFIPFCLQAGFDGAGLKYHLKCATEFKTCYGLWYGPLRAAVVVCHPDTVQVIQSSNAPKEKFIYDIVKPFLGKSSTYTDPASNKCKMSELCKFWTCLLLSSYQCSKICGSQQTVVLQIWQAKTAKKLTCVTFFCVIALRNWDGSPRG